MEMEGEEEQVLDLTSSQLHDLSDVNIPQGIVELDLTANRLSKLDDRFANLSNLQKISLRQNLFTDEALQPLSKWSALFGLQELVLRDNKLTRIPNVDGFTNLVVFDVSFNEITSLVGMHKVSPKLRELYVSKNEVSKIEEVSHFHDLQILELGSNKIRVMEGLEDLAKLQELWLGRNRIKAVNVHGLSNLVKISLQSNRLTSMLGFQECVKLEELYLSHNAISHMEGLSELMNLRVLDVSSNRLTSISDISKLARLEDLWLNDNLIPTLEGIDQALCGCKESLVTIYLERNPCTSDPAYKDKLRSALPNLQQIDSNVL